MIFELCSNRFNGNVVIKPIDYSFDAWDLQDMMMKAFPKDVFYIICHNGYENALEFVKEAS